MTGVGAAPAWADRARRPAGSGAGRRRAGVVVVALGLLAAVVVPLAAGRTIPGTPQAVPVPGPPVAGNCVGQQFNISGFMVVPQPGKYSYPEMTAGECNRSHYGEVVAMIARPTTPTVQIDLGGGFSVSDDNMDFCFKAAGGFLGLRTSTDEQLLFGYWSLTAFPPVVPMKPTARQRAAGQHWLACVSYLSKPVAVVDSPAVPYVGTLRAARTTGVGRDYLGSCPTVGWNRPDSTDCRQPHHGEIFGTGSASKDVARTSVMASCAKLVGYITERPDLVGNGQLIINMEAEDSSGKVRTGPTIPMDSSLQCGVLTTGDRLLKGSLLAIGTNPIPWA